MRILKKILLWFVCILLLLNAAILATGNSHIYKGLSNTYFKGRSGPSIDEYRIFPYNVVKAGTPQPWPRSAAYNKKKISAEQLQDFSKYDTKAFIVVKGDSILHEEYWDGYSSASVSNSFSMAKSIVGVLTGVALKQGKIKSLDQPVADFLPQFKEGAAAKITIRHLLTMSSGIDFDEDYVSPFAYPAKAYYGEELEELTFSYKATEEPGKVFKYLSGNTALLAFVLKKATGKSLATYASENLWKPMGAVNDAFWSLDHENGVEKAYCCFNSNASDFARIGKLYLDFGNWKGQSIIDSGYVVQATHPATLIDGNGKPNEVYGFQWWVMKDKQGRHVSYARGILGQYIFVVPDRDLVIVRLGSKRDSERIGEHPKDAFVYLETGESLAK